MELEPLVKQFVERGLSSDLRACLTYLQQRSCHNLVLFFYEMCKDVFDFDKELLAMVADSYLAVGESKYAWRICMDALTSSTLTLAQLNQFASYASKCQLPSFSTYPEQKIKEMMTRNSPLPFVTLTITTCKRYDLFERTINSFIQCCEDLHLISHWICVDDNSNDADRELMRQKYPFFQFIFKDEASKGHPQSMNLILKSVHTPYFFHLEDDWEFFRPGTYIQDCLEVLSQNPSFGQCLLNRNYMELHTDTIQGGFFNKTENGLIYFIHEHEPNNEVFQSKYGFVSNCAYWPHYSLRPGLNRTQAILHTGVYSTTANHFEMEFSYRYAKLGYKTTFLDWVSCQHIGRLTRDRFDQSKQNAYILNNEQQFTKQPTKSSSRFHAYVINLDRRADRYTAFQDALPPSFSVERVSAVDGQRIQPTRGLEQLFEKNDYNFRRGMIGCALSHLSLWIQCTHSSVPFLILEDDVTFVADFELKLDYLLSSLPESWDVVFLGHHIYPDYQTDQTFDTYSVPELTKVSAQEALQQSRGGTGGYLVSPSGARRLLEFIQQHSMTNGIDTMMQKASDVCDVYFITPHLIYSECFTLHKQDVDTDIQRDYTSLRRSDDAMLDSEIAFWTAHHLPYSRSSHAPSGDVITVHESVCDTMYPEGHFTYFIGEMYHAHIPETIHLPSFRLRLGESFSLDHLLDVKN